MQWCSVDCKSTNLLGTSFDSAHSHQFLNSRRVERNGHSWLITSEIAGLTPVSATSFCPSSIKGDAEVL